MTLKVQLFAGASQQVGQDAVELELPDDATYEDLAAKLAAAQPCLAGLIAASRFAADAEYVSLEVEVDPQAEIALIPPVSGG